MSFIRTAVYQLRAFSRALQSGERIVARLRKVMVVESVRNRFELEGFADAVNSVCKELL